MSRFPLSHTTVERERPVGRARGEGGQPKTWWQKALALPPNFFSIPMGLAGLAGIWQFAGKFFSAPFQISGTLYLVTTLVYLFLCGAFVCKILFARQAAIADLTSPVLGPFNALLPLSGMLLALGLDPSVHHMAQGIFLAFLVMATLLGGWMVSRWMMTRPDLHLLHSGYYLPTVAVDLIGADGLTRFSLIGLAWAFFGAGVLCWLMTGPIVLARLFTRPPLPPRLIPTLAIEVAPAALAGNAYFSLTSGRIDIVAALFTGYAFLTFLVQLCLVPTYRRLPFAVTFWSFTFPFAALIGYALRWLHFGHFAGSTLLTYALLTVITLLIGGIALRSLSALKRNLSLPDIATSR